MTAGSSEPRCISFNGLLCASVCFAGLTLGSFVPIYSNLTILVRPSTRAAGRETRVLSSSFLPFTPKRNQVSYESRAGRQSHETGDVTPRARSRVSPRDRGGTVQRHTGRRTRADGRALASPISVSVLMSPGLLSSRLPTRHIGRDWRGLPEITRSAGQTGRVLLQVFKFVLSR